MSTSYYIRIYSTTGSLVAVTDRFTSARVEHKVNYPSQLTVSFHELEPVVSLFQTDVLVNLRRCVTEARLDWYDEFVGLYRTPQRQHTTGDQRTFTPICVGLLDLIHRRSLRYFTIVDCGLPPVAPADDAIKQLVRDNAGPAALVANGRATNGATPGLAVQDNASLAPGYQGATQGKNLLDTIRDIGQPNKVDFDVVWGGPSAPLTFEFRTYYPQLGTDRRAGSPNPFVFSTQLGNMANPSFAQARTDEVTNALLFDTFGNITVRTSSHINDSPLNLIELDQDARGEDRTDALNAMGDKILYDKRPAINFNFDVLQTPYATYNKHYFLGDLVTGRFSSIQADVKIRAVTLDITSTGETVRLTLEEVPI